MTFRLLRSDYGVPVMAFRLEGRSVTGVRAPESGDRRQRRRHGSARRRAHFIEHCDAYASTCFSINFDNVRLLISAPSWRITRR